MIRTAKLATVVARPEMASIADSFIFINVILTVFKTIAKRRL
jgi:predicted rRNA methylase YqxC with S4 and FtsJ domains